MMAVTGPILPWGTWKPTWKRMRANLTTSVTLMAVTKRFFRHMGWKCIVGYIQVKGHTPVKLRVAIDHSTHYIGLQLTNGFTLARLLTVSLTTVVNSSPQRVTSRNTFVSTQVKDRTSVKLTGVGRLSQHPTTWRHIQWPINLTLVRRKDVWWTFWRQTNSRIT